MVLYPILTAASCAAKISKKAGKMVWYSHLFNNFPVFCDPHSFSVINEADFFFNSLAFSMIRLLDLWFLYPF